MSPDHQNIYYALLQPGQDKVEKPFITEYLEDRPAYELTGDDEREEASITHRFIGKRGDDLPTEDGDSDHYDGVMDEHGISKGSHDFLDSKADLKYIYESTKLRTIKPEPKSDDE